LAVKIQVKTLLMTFVTGLSRVLGAFEFFHKAFITRLISYAPAAGVKMDRN